MKKGIILCLVFLGFIPVSCLQDSCGGRFKKDEIRVTNFRITRFDIANTDINGNLLDTSNYYPVDSVFKMFFILEKMKVAKHKSTNFSFSTPLYACSPAEPMSVNKIIDIDIISKSSFDEFEIPVEVGDNIKKLFFFKVNNDSYYYIYSDYLSSKFGYETDKLFIRPNFYPSENFELRFDVIISMSDGAKHEFNDQVLKIK